MKAIDAFDYLTPSKWITLSPLSKIEILEEVRCNIQTYKKEIADTEVRLKNGLMGENLYLSPESYLSTTAPIANLINTLINLYTKLIKNGQPKPNFIKSKDIFTYDVNIQPFDLKERLLSVNQKFYLRVKGKPKQTNPLTKEAGVIAIISSGSVSSNMEVLKALFLENKTVIHKPHRLNEDIEKLWRKVLKPLIKARALEYCNVDEGEALSKLEGLHQIYFSGEEKTNSKIIKSTNTPVVSQLGSNNPLIIVPGIRPWTISEIKHKANEIATVSKLNGGAICGRPQTIITCAKWNQRDLFLMELKKAIVNTTPAAGTYYPSSIDKKNDFLNNVVDYETLHPENGKYKYSDFIIKTNSDIDNFSNKNEAFFQFLNEVPLFTNTNQEEFLEKAVNYCNNNLFGDLGCMIIIDDSTKFKFEKVLEKSIDNLKYKNIAINSILPNMLLNPYFSTANSTNNSKFNFSNIYGFENVEKSILIDSFISITHIIRTNKSAFYNLALSISNYVFKPSWKSLSKVLSIGLYNRLLRPDF